MTSALEPPAHVPPSPKGHFFTGSLFDYLQDPLTFLTQCAREYGDVVRIWFGPFPMYLLSHPDTIEEVLVTKSNQFVKSRGLRSFHRILGNGILLSEGSFWQRQRRLMQPAFHRERIAAYADVMVAYTERMLTSWQDGAIRNVDQEMTGLTLAIVAKTFFDANVDGGKAEAIGAAFTVAMEHMNTQISNLFLLPDWVPTLGNLRYQRAARKVDRIIYDIIHQRRVSGEDPGDLLSMLLKIRDEDGSRMTDLQVRDEVMTLFLAGHETTTLTLSWTWYLLAQHPEVEAKLAKELQTVLHGQTPTFTDLPQLQYTEKIVKESLRLYPPAWGVGRQVLQDCEVGGYQLPAGSTAFMSQWIVQRDSRFFQQPEMFNPDRWTDELTKSLPTFAYFPFGGGSRICIGKSFAMMEAVLILAAIAQKFCLSLVPGHPVIPHAPFTLRPKHGIKMLLSKR